MYNQFIYLGYDERNIEGKEFLVIYVLEFSKKQIFKIYKTANKDLIFKLDALEDFSNINDFIGFVIKRDGKISLDIKL